jgi:lactate permease
LLIGLGFRPLEAAKLALIGNTAPVAFGVARHPARDPRATHRLDLDLQALSAMVGRQLPFSRSSCRSGSSQRRPDGAA